MNNEILKNFLRIFLLSLIQIFVLKEIVIFGENGKYSEILIYPLGLILLPLSTPRFFLFFFAFLTGIWIDIFYDTLGVHAAACLWMAFARPYVLKFMEPKSGYTMNQHPVAQELGVFWFMQYMAILLGIFVFAYFSMKIFTLVYIADIVIRSVLSFTISYFILFLIQIIFDPKS